MKKLLLIAAILAAPVTATEPEWPDQYAKDCGSEAAKAHADDLMQKHGAGYIEQGSQIYKVTGQYNDKIKGKSRVTLKNYTGPVVRYDVRKFERACR